ncbi:Auxin efflux carrier [Carpediemonas membranifera]|uniref:Auxin efflux carrier n=1 Tax=Carpediemonas membranifera TaxID=201153 RepID=A0A8J6AS28_9EUKA|nr:Auxin efflux carrier [Carpediemonas membranifera]|eukprot:KAG9392623.1 Auxin efflux carrier [Carpediemonas membranifera]
MEYEEIILSCILADGFDRLIKILAAASKALVTDWTPASFNEEELQGWWIRWTPSQTVPVTTRCMALTAELILRILEVELYIFTFLGIGFAYRRITGTFDNRMVFGVNSFATRAAAPLLLLKLMAETDFYTLDKRLLLVFVVFRLANIAALLPVLWAAKSLSIPAFFMGYTCMTWGNTIALGIPVVDSLLGSEYIYINAISSTVDRAITLPVLWALCEYYKARQELGAGSKTPKETARLLTRTVRKVVANPMFLCVIAGILLSLAGISLPSVLVDVGTTMGKSLTATGLFALGATFDFKLLFPSRSDAAKILSLLFLRHILSFLTMSLVMMVLGIPRTRDAVAVIVVATLPLARTVFGMSQEFGLGAGLMASVSLVGLAGYLPLLFIQAPLAEIIWNPAG